MRYQYITGVTEEKPPQFILLKMFWILNSSLCFLTPQPALLILVGIINVICLAWLRNTQEELIEDFGQHYSIPLRINYGLIISINLGIMAALIAWAVFSLYISIYTRTIYPYPQFLHPDCV